MLGFLKRKNLRGIVLLSNKFVPKLIGGFLPKLSDKQRRAFDKVMPEGGKKRIYFQLLGTPTPPIVVHLAQPLYVDVMTEEQIAEEGMKGLVLQVDELPSLMASISGSKDIVGALKGLKGQALAMLSLMRIFAPLVSLGPSEIKDLRIRAMKHFKPLLSLLSR
jgi:hypothetical protein